MFRREEHRAVLRALQALDADLLKSHQALFGGGTRLVLELGEYRISQDIDFLSSDARAFAELRNRARQEGPEAFFEEQGLAGIEFPREIRADQYGIRFAMVADGCPIKFELISEGRIDLDAGARPKWSPVVCLTLFDGRVAFHSPPRRALRKHAKNIMTTKNRDSTEQDDLREEYDLASLGPGVRGKYYERTTSGTNLVLLDPDVARAFPTQEAVNEALRMLAEIAETSSRRRSG